MKIGIVGSRTFTDLGLVEDYIRNLPLDSIIISGGARGVDSCAAKVARDKGLQVVEYLPDYEMYGRRAPLLRNITIINSSDYLIAFWDGQSHGTKHVIDYCKKHNKSITVYKNRWIRNISFTVKEMFIELEDGRILQSPISLTPRLAKATPEQLVDYQLIGYGQGIHWPQLDEDLHLGFLFRNSRTAKELQEHLGFSSTSQKIQEKILAENIDDWDSE